MGTLIFIFIFVFLYILVIGIYAATKANTSTQSFTPPPWKPAKQTETKTSQDDSPIQCPKCGCTQLHTDKKGFSVLKAAGGMLLIPGGIFWGLHGRNKIVITCLKCGNKWKV